MNEHEQPAHDPLWPPITSACRPWTRWWWMGSAVDEAEITRQLQLFHAAGIGGVEISPIYGVTGEEARSIPFLSSRWIHMLRHTVREAQRLDLGVDMLCGTGWPLGGPWVRAEDAAARVAFETYTVARGARVAEPIVSKREPRATLRVLSGFSRAGQVLDLSQYVDAERRLNWTAPAGHWRVYALFHIRAARSCADGAAAPASGALVLQL